MVVVTEKAAEVRHGHEKKAGSKTDKPAGALIKRYPFSTFGKKRAIKKAFEQHHAIVKSQDRQKEHLDAGAVAVRGSVKTASIAPKPLMPHGGYPDQGSGVATTAPRMPYTPVADGMLTMSVDTPEQDVHMVPIPPQDSLIQQLSVTSKMPASRPGDLVEQRDLNGIPYGPASDPAKIQAGITKPVDRTKRLSPIYYAEPSEDDQAVMELLEPKIIELFSNDPPKDDAALHAIAEEWGMDPDVVETAVYRVLASFLSEGLSKEDGATVPPEKMTAGMVVEMEHTTSPWIAAKIAADHLTEDPEYYEKLATIEHAEIHMDNSQSVIGLQVTPADTQFPTSAIKQDADTEAVQKRDQPAYNDGEDNADIDPDEEWPEDDDERDDDMWVEAFSAGDHRDSEGTTNRWTPAHLDTIAQQYNAKSDPKNPERKMAPVVIGHPKDDSPAYGWIDKVQVKGEKLMAHLSQLNKDFVQALKEGAYKTRSISLYPDLNIRHLGFLGGVQPAVPGLGPFKFADDGSQATTYEFASPVEGDVETRMLKRENAFFRKLFARFKVEVQPKDHSEPGPQDRVPITRDDTAPTINSEKGNQMSKHEEGTPVPLVKEGEKTVQIVKQPDKMDADKNPTHSDDADADDERDKKLGDLQKKFDELSKKYEELCKTSDEAAKKFAEETKKHEEDERTRGYREFCEGLVSEGRMRPADVDTHVKNMVLRQKADSEAKDFAESKATPELDMYKQWLGAQPQVIEFNEIATHQTAKGPSDPTRDASDKVTDFCEAYMKADPKMTWDKAMLRCRDEHPSEVAEYLGQALSR